MTPVSVGLLSRGTLLASGGADDTIHLWNLAKRPYALVRTLTGDSGYIRSVAFSPDGKTLASGSTDKRSDCGMSRPEQSSAAHLPVT